MTPAMSDAPSDADLHALFDMDAAASPGADSSVELERDADEQAAVEIDLTEPKIANMRPHRGEPTIEIERSDRAEESDSPEAQGGLGRSVAEPARVAEERNRTGVTRSSGPSSRSRFLTDVIVELGFVSSAQAKEAIDTSRSTGTTPEHVLISSGALTHDQLARALAERYGLDHLDLSIFSVDMAAANLVTSAAAKRYQAVPVAFADKRTLIVAMADPSNVLAVDDIAIMTGYEVRVAVTAPEDVAALISRLNRLEDAVGDPEGLLEEAADGGAEVVELHESAEDAPVIKLVNQIVAQAVERRASDVHLAPQGRELRVRFRVDGVLQDVTTIPRRMAAGVVSRVKIMADLNIAERRVPQDGRVGLAVDGRHIDLRVVTLPSVHGEAVVLRVLDKASIVVKLDSLGLADAERERFEHAFNQAHGAVLVTGPTGSGKTTTLYAALQVLNTTERNILTVEDPVEYEMDGLTQLQVSTKAGLTFAAGLRSMMRADPDVIMVGEIRDQETARIAVESALTGHLVLSTMHTNDAPSAITRLIEMDIEPFLVASAIDCVVAQRLARMLCSSCKRRAIVPAEVLRENGYKALVDLESYEPVGCRRCGGSGFRGRLGLYEVMTVSPEIQSMTLERRPAEEIRDLAVRQGMRRLREDGLEKVRQGRTSVAEVLRVIGSS
jgi:type IV pilus assembly protein PilB